jgi:uncharacterized membrane protein YkoI
LQPTNTLAGGLAVLCLSSLLPVSGAANVKITLEQARSIVLKAHPGTITDEELEKEKGGSGLRYSFDIKSGKITYEVGVDAQTGKVLEDSKEGRHPD